MCEVWCDYIGSDLLYVAAMSTHGPVDELVLTHQGSGLYDIKYKAPERGRLLIYVKYGDDHVPGSPFDVVVEWFDCNYWYIYSCLIWYTSTYVFMLFTVWLLTLFFLLFVVCLFWDQIMCSAFVMFDSSLFLLPSCNPLVIFICFAIFICVFVYVLSYYISIP